MLWTASVNNFSEDKFCTCIWVGDLGNFKSYLHVVSSVSATNSRLVFLETLPNANIKIYLQKRIPDKAFSFIFKMIGRWFGFENVRLGVLFLRCNF